MVAALAVALALGPAASAAPPPPAGRAVALTEPGVVFLRTWVEVAARLTIPDRSKLSRFSSIKKRYASPYATGSGFAVNRNGAIVTASHAVEPSRQDIRNYAANRMYFNSLGGLGYRLGGRSPFGEYHLGATSRVPRQVATILDGLLQDCYDAAAPDRGPARPPPPHPRNTSRLPGMLRSRSTPSPENDTAPKRYPSRLPPGSARSAAATSARARASAAGAATARPEQAGRAAGNVPAALPV